MQHVFGVKNPQDRQCAYTVTLRRVHATSLPLFSRIQSACAVLYCRVACLGLPFLSVSHKPHDFMGKKVTGLKMCFDFLYNFFSETFLIVRRLHRDTVINVRRSSYKIPVILIF
jgi:hypothetical protein